MMFGVTSEAQSTQKSTHQAALIALCYEYAVLTTRAEAGIRLAPGDQRVLKGLSSLIESNVGGVRDLRAFQVSVRAWIEAPVVKLAATVVGLSGGGLLLTAWSSIRPGTVVTIQIAEADRALDVIGTIRWSEPRGGEIRLGVEFSPVPIAEEPLLAVRNFHRSA